MPTYTVDVSGVEREDGERGYIYVVQARSEAAARKAVLAFHRSDLLPEHCDAVRVDRVQEGVPSPRCRDHWNDLRYSCKRAKQGGLAIKGWRNGRKADPGDVIDAVSDILHYAALNGLSVDDVTRLARDHYRFEVENGGEL
jgi:hypothetical protein